MTTHRIPGFALTDRTFVVPLDHSRPGGERIQIYAREVVAAEKECTDLPWLLFLQGGPGMPSPRPDSRTGWLKRAVQEYRVLLLDQRGTGRSTPATFQTLARFSSPGAIADYLGCFRADSIVRDAEWIRRELLGEAGRWSLLGQSYGGFCVVHYLSVAPDSLREAMITGGLPPLERPADDVYRAAYRRVRGRNRLYYRRYPEDVERGRAVIRYLQRHPVSLPSGDRLSPRRFQQLGICFGAGDGFEQVHYLLEQAFVPGPNGEEINYTFLRGVEDAHHFDTNPLYAVLHEAIYCQRTASRWSAERVRTEHPEFDPAGDGPVYFTGEMIYPWMFDEYRRLRPLKEAAEILAATEEWPRLYDPVVLRANTVPCVAAVYYDDMYVDRELSEETAQSISGIRLWITSEYQHDALRVDGERLLGRLLQMLRGEI